MRKMGAEWDRAVPRASARLEGHASPMRRRGLDRKTAQPPPGGGGPTLIDGLYTNTGLETKAGTSHYSTRVAAIISRSSIFIFAISEKRHFIVDDAKRKVHRKDEAHRPHIVGAPRRARLSSRRRCAVRHALHRVSKRPLQPRDLPV